MLQPYHTTLGEGGILKPFYSAESTETDNETEYGDNGMPALQAMDDEEEGEGDSDVDDDEEEEEEDPLDALDDDER